ncbi:Hsp20 family protein [Tepidibacter thalassicus]|uniref:Heat shock protein Hsp20 n=1 Tax=Tepidibacter thalassicus DSM 15285 TaxID=1123350 RepID=A0A1M5Q688_9FIRM|nr:Hsp20 family protein [Tepidibacter thalassicus]SHH09279.1 heat shock protein Hsp20 [Tepidibacter thalassicus DSM 15285]
MFDMVPFKKNNNSITKKSDYFNHLFNNFFEDDFFPTTVFGNNFKVDLKETKNEYIIEADLPGINKEAINIDYENNYLTISAKREETIEDKNDTYVRRERNFSTAGLTGSYNNFSIILFLISLYKLYSIL